MTTQKIECSPAVLDEVVRHVNSVTDSEVGGVLVGVFDGRRTRVTAAIPAHSATSGSANVTFTHEVWEEVLPIIDRDHPDERLIGWYHSHPGFGVFLSDYDLFIQRNFFPDPAMVALVIDPLKGEGGWFEWDSDRIELTTTFSTPSVRSASEVASALEQRATTRRTSLVIGVAGLAFVTLLIGYLLGGALAPRKEQAAVPTSEQSVVESLQGEIDRLSNELRSQPEVTQFASCTYSYTVVPGDGFWSIAQRHLSDGTRASELKDLNPAAAAEGLDPGDVLQIPTSNCTLSKSAMR